MKLVCLYLIPFFSVFTTLLSCFLFFKVALGSPHWRRAFFDACADFVAASFPLQDLARQQFDEKSQALRALLEERYERFIAALKQRIPMAEMIMQGSIANSLKEQVQTEIEALLPELKNRAVEKLITPDEMRDWVKISLQNSSQLPLFLDKLMRQFLWKSIFSLTAISLSFGLLQLLFFLYVCFL
jgi:hypothetical protein